MPTVTPDDFAAGGWFKVTLDLGDLKEEAHFQEIGGLNVYIDQCVVQEGGRNTNPVVLPGPARYEPIVLRRGTTKSKAFFNWIASAVTRDVKRTSGKIALCSRDGNPIMEWTFERGWPCRWSGPKLDSRNPAYLALEEVEIAHEGLKLQA
jgi:phage tail-like protein